VKRRLFCVCGDLEAQLKGNSEAERLTEFVWNAHYNEPTVDARDATAMIEALIGKMNAKRPRERAAVVLDAVSRAVKRSLVLGLEDGRKAADLHAELSARWQDLWSAMYEPSYVFYQEDEDKIPRADTALRKLNIKRRDV
jgi:hypothetical protein